MELSITYAPNGENLHSAMFEYDKNGNLIHLKWMGGLNTENIYTHDNFGNEIEYKSVGLNGQLSDHRVMTYKDKLVMTRTHYKNDKLSLYFKFEYEHH